MPLPMDRWVHIRWIMILVRGRVFGVVWSEGVLRGPASIE